MKDQQVDSSRLVKNTLMMYLRMAVNMLIGLFTSRLILQALGFIDYGLYNVVGGVVLFLGFINSTLTTGTWRFAMVGIAEGDIEKMKRIFNSSLFLHIMICLLIVILCETIGLWFFYDYMQIPADRLTESFWIYQLSILVAIVSIINVPYSALMVAHERMGAFAYISITETVFKLLVTLSLFLFPSYRLVIYAALLSLSAIAVRIMYTIYCRRNFEECVIQFHYDKTVMKEMLSFASYNSFVALGKAGSGQGLNILLNVFFGPIVNAARGIAVPVQNMLLAFIQSFLVAVEPQITKLYSNNEMYKAHQLITYSAKFSYYVMFIIALPVIFEMKPLLLLWLGKIPEYTVGFCIFSLIIAILETISFPFNVCVTADGRIKKYYGVTGLLIFTVLPFAYIALKLGYNPLSVYIVHTAFALIVLLWKTLYGSRIISYNLKRLFNDIFSPIFVVTCLGTIIAYILKRIISNERILDVIIYILVLASFLMPLIYFFGMSKKEREYLSAKIKTKFH